MEGSGYRFIEAALGRATSVTPVWLMRQAGRYMSSYQAIKAKYSFIEMIETPELAARVTLQPVDELGVDAAILFSDILVTAAAMGCQFDYIEGRGPIFQNPIRSLNQVAALDETAVEKLNFVSNAIRILLPELLMKKVPLIGFAGAPFTVAAFMIAGKSPSDFSWLRDWMNAHSQAAHRLLEKLSVLTIHYLNAQLRAGVHAIQIFDTLLDQLTIPEFEQWAWPYLKHVVNGLERSQAVPLIIFSKSTDRFWPYFAQLPIQVISVDYASNIDDLAQKVPQHIALQGNLDPKLLVSVPADLQQQVIKMVQRMRNRPGYIFNLGHGVLKETNPVVVRQLVEWVHAIR